MQRVLSTVTLLGLLVATAAAFAITEHLKLIKSPIYGTLVTKAFSPVCGCALREASISVKLRHSDRLTVTIEDAARHTVATLASNLREPKGRVTFYWNGRTDANTIAPSGAYRPQIKLARRTILLPNTIALDTTLPKVLSASDGKGVFAPGAKHTIAIHYVLSEQAHAVVYLDGLRLIRGRPTRTHGVVKWAGRNRAGKVLPAGRYVLQVGALDLSGNETPASGRKSVVVVIRFLALARRVIRVRADSRFSVRVETASSRYTWRLAGKHGAAHGPTLRLRAPARRGRYRLVVTEHGHPASALLIVAAK